ncbi:MAG: protein phosphatase 2C domain-containing protein [Gemmatimonadaceae bacterium]|nr:protein phosphatase 2C domain-containing protein [Gemmatimonadaceae bacterium]
MDQTNSVSSGRPSPAEAWRIVGGSVRGTSHVDSGTPCQDACEFAILRAGDDAVAAIVTADGAGSSAHSDEGAELACAALLGEVSDYLDGYELSAIDSQVVEEWFVRVHQAVTERAAELNVQVRELACTLLLGVVGMNRAVCAQIGDGAIVVNDATAEGGYAPVTWPQSGEYANQTFFATDQEALRHLQIALLEDRRIDEIALFSDGLEKLALNMGTRSAHGPFFESLFRQLRPLSRGATANIEGQFRAFLDSPAVNARTDDDKTLVLATRRHGASLLPVSNQ